MTVDAELKPNTLQLGDILAPEMIQKLYLELRNQGGVNRNPFASLAINTAVRSLFDAYSKVRYAQAAVLQAATLHGPSNAGALREFIEETNMVHIHQLEKLVTKVIDSHVSTHADRLEEALQNMGIPQEKIDQLPHTKERHVDDSFAAGPRSGASILFETYYGPQIRELFAGSDKALFAGQAR